MDILFILASITVVLFLAYILINGFKRPHKYPPGPQWYPIVGNTPFIRKLTRKFGAMHHTFSYLAKLYDTNVLGLKLGTEYYIVVQTEQILRQVFTRDEFQARPDTFFIRLRSMGTRRGITMVDGPIWKEQRSFALHHLRDLGFGKAVMEDLIVEELQDFLKKVNKGGEIDWSKFLAPSVLNVLWALAAGTRFEPDDPRLDGLLKLMDERSSAFDMSGGLLNQMPWLRFIAPEYTGFNLIDRLNAQLSQLLKDTIAEHKRTLNPAKTRDFIDAFLHQMNTDKQTPTKESYFTDDQLVMVCLDFFIAGSQTTSNTLNFAFLTLLHRPDIQQRIHEEIDKFLPNGKLPSLADRSKLPYTEAVLSEFQRFEGVVPIGGPRRVTRTTNLDGYIIPEGTTVLLNLYEHQHNQELWEDPETIRPERFLNDEGKFDPDLIFGFGLGKRRCLGEVLAKNFIFLFFVGVLKQFKLSPVAGKELPTLQPKPGITLSPKPYTMFITSRKKEI